MRHPNDPLLTDEEAGELLGTGPAFVRQLAAQHEIECVRSGGRLLIPQSALIGWAAGL